MSCDSTHKCLCKWWILTKRPSTSQEMSSSSRREVTQRTNHSRYCYNLSLCIFIALHLYLKSLKPYLRMLNIFDLLLSIMQTDNYVYFFLPIDIYTVFLMNTTDGIKDKCSYKKALQLLSSQQFVIVIFIFAFISPLALVAYGPTNKEKHRQPSVWIHVLF